MFCVNGTLKITGLTMEGLAEIYAGKRDWEKGKRIRLVLRHPEDSDIPVLKSMSPAMSAAVDVALRRKGMIVATTDGDAADAIENVPGAFGGTTLSLVLSEKRALRVLTLDGVVPSVRTMTERSYPYRKTFFMMTRKNPSDCRSSFHRFRALSFGSGHPLEERPGCGAGGKRPSMKGTGRHIPRLIEGFGGLLLVILAVALPVLYFVNGWGCIANISGRRRRSMPDRCPP